MSNLGDPKDEEDLDIEEIESSPAPKRLKSRPEELTQIGREEADSSPPPSQRSSKGTSSVNRENNKVKENRVKNKSNPQLVVVGVLAILILFDVFIIYQISSLNNRLDDINSDISKLTNGSASLLKDMEYLNNNLGDYRKSSYIIPTDFSIQHLDSIPKFTTIESRIWKNLNESK